MVPLYLGPCQQNHNTSCALASELALNKGAEVFNQIQLRIPIAQFPALYCGTLQAEQQANRRILSVLEDRQEPCRHTHQSKRGTVTSVEAQRTSWATGQKGDLKLGAKKPIAYENNRSAEFAIPTFNTLRTL